MVSHPWSIFAQNLVCWQSTPVSQYPHHLSSYRPLHLPMYSRPFILLILKNQAQLRAAKDTAEGTNNSHEEKKRTKMCLAYEVTITSQLKHVIMLSMFIGNSGIIKFSFGTIIIMTHRFTLYMQGKWGNQKITIPQHIFLHLNVIFNKHYAVDQSRHIRYGEIQFQGPYFLT